MRIATLIVGLLLGLLLFIQAFGSMIFGAEGGDTATAGAAGFVMALMWLLASALVIAFPAISAGLFAVSSLIGFAVPTGDFGDIRFHAGAAIVLTVMAIFGWRGKRKQQQEQMAERRRQDERDELLMRMAHVQNRAPVGRVCQQCGTANDPNVKFCRECGAAMAAMPLQAQ